MQHTNFLTGAIRFSEGSTSVARRILSLLIAAIVLLNLPGFTAESKFDLVKAAESVAKSLVVVEYELQYDKSDVPTGGLGAERCPNCGQFHGNDLRQYLEEDRPVEAAGFLIAPDRAATKDPDLHPRFIKAISVRYGGQSVLAQIESRGVSQAGVILKLDAPLRSATPLKFTPAKGNPAGAVSLTWQLGKWSASSNPYLESMYMPADEPAYRYTHSTGVAVTEDGTPMGLILDGWLPMGDDWQGSPMSWKLESADSLEQKLAELRQKVRANLLRVHLSFRSPKSTAGDQRNYRGRRYDDELSENVTEADVVGAVLPGSKLLVLANLDHKTTARLERIIAHPHEGDPVSAEFSATLKDFGAFVAIPEKPLSLGINVNQDSPASLTHQLLLRADVSLHGESRAEYFHTARFAALTRGPKNRVYPSLEGPDPEDGFLFSPDGKLVAFSLERREPVSSQQDSYSRGETDLLPATYVMEAVARLPETADLSNVPVSEEDENRLAWIGAELQPLDQDLARANNVSTQTRDGETGGLVTYVYPGSPAAAAGINPGDILLRLIVEGRPLPLEVRLQDDSMRAQAFPWDRLDEVPAQYFDRIPSPWSPVENTFVRALTDLGFGTKYSAEVFAGGKLLTKAMEVVVGPAHFESAVRFKSESLGITVRDLTYEVRRYLQRELDEPGVVVSKVEAGGTAGVAGVRPYELITHVNDQPVNTVKDFETLVSSNGELKLSMKRMSKGRIVTIKAAN